MYWCHAFKSGDEIDAFLMSFPTDFFFSKKVQIFIDIY